MSHLVHGDSNGSRTATDVELLTLFVAARDEDAFAELVRRLDIATGKSALVNDLPLNGTVGSYCWSPDGKRIAYTWRERHDGKSEDLINKETESHLVACDSYCKNRKTIASEKAEGQWIVTIGDVDWQ